MNMFSLILLFGTLSRSCMTEMVQEPQVEKKASEFPRSQKRGEPWHLDAGTQEAIRMQIEQKHEQGLADVSRGIAYFADECSKRVNYSEEVCPFCQKDDLGLEIEKRVAQAGFIRARKITRVSGHCFGVSVSFLKMFLEQNWVFSNLSCQEMLEWLVSRSDFIETSHAFSVNQPGLYGRKGGPFQELYPVLANPKMVGLFLETLIGKRMDGFYYLHREQVNAKEFTQEAIYATLKQMPNKILLISLQAPKASYPHAVVLSTFSNKLFVFDSEIGMFQFKDLETMSKLLGRAWNQSALHYIASFSSEGS